jgi:hypothetical protein
MFNRERNLMDDWTPRELAPGDSGFDYPLPKAFDEAKRIKLAIGQKWEDRVQEKVPAKRVSLNHPFLLFFALISFFLFCLH